MTKTIPLSAIPTEKLNVTLDAKMFSFKGNSKNLESYKAEVLAHQNEIGLLVFFTYNTFGIKYKDGILQVPKNWVIIL